MVLKRKLIFLNSELLLSHCYSCPILTRFYIALFSSPLQSPLSSNVFFDDVFLSYLVSSSLPSSLILSFWLIDCSILQSSSSNRTSSRLLCLEFPAATTLLQLRAFQFHQSTATSPMTNPTDLILILKP